MYVYLLYTFPAAFYEPFVSVACVIDRLHFFALVPPVLWKKTTAFTDRGWQSHIYNLFFNFIILDWIRQAACKSRLFLKRFRFSKLWEQRANEKNSWAVNSKFQIYLYNKIYLTETSRETERGIPSYLTEKITRSLYMMLKEPNEDNKYSVKY